MGFDTIEINLGGFWWKFLVLIGTFETIFDGITYLGCGGGGG